MTAYQDMKHPTLVIIRGLPGSGKTYLASALRESIKKSIGEDAVVMLDPDATDYLSQEYIDHTKKQAAEGVDPKLHAYRFLRAKAHKGIAAHKIIIWNQPFTNLEIFNKMIANLQGYASENNTQLSILVVEVAVDPATAKERITKRKQAGGHGPSDDTFNRFIGDFKSFVTEGYVTVSVRGQDDVSASVASVMQALQALL